MYNKKYKGCDKMEIKELKQAYQNLNEELEKIRRSL